MDISTIEKKDLVPLLKDLKKFEKLKKDLGKRGEKIFFEKKYGQDSYKVEFSANLQKDQIIEKAQKLFKDYFGKEVSEDQIIWKEDTQIIGGMKVFFNDKLIDLSADSILKKIK